MPNLKISLDSATDQNVLKLGLIQINDDYLWFAILQCTLKVVN